MKWLIRLSMSILLAYSSSVYATNTYDSSKLSSEGKLFPETLIQIRCLRTEGRYSEEFCKKTPERQKIIDELLQQDPPQFWGHVDLVASSSAATKPTINEYIVWAKTVPSDDWIELTNHPDAEVRVLAFQALVFAYPDIDFIPIIINHFHEVGVVWRSEYDMVSENEKVADVFMDIAARSSFFRLQIDNFTPMQRERLWKALVEVPNVLEALSDFVLQMPHTAEFYGQLKSIKDKNAAVIYTLAQYRNPQDIPLILNYLATGQEDKRTALTEHYMKIFNSEELFEIFNYSLSGREAENFKFNIDVIIRDYSQRILVRLYDAAVSRLNEKEIYSLNNFLMNTKELSDNNQVRHKELLFGAISKDSTGKSDELLWYFWEEENRVKLTDYEHLTQQDPVRALKLTVSNLKNLEKYYVDNRGSSDNSVSRLVRNMLDFTLERNKNAGIDIIKYHFVEPEKPYDAFYQTFVTKVIQLQDKQFVDVMFSLLEDDYHYFVHHAVLVLLSFEDAALNEKIAQSLNEKRSLRTTKNWQWLYQKFEDAGVLDGKPKPNSEVKLDVIFRL